MRGTNHGGTVHEVLGRNPVHPFPARMAPGIALRSLKDRRRGIRVLDPMMGSGTVVAVARSMGHATFGIDIDPLAVLISGVWTKAADVTAARNKAVDVLRQARKAVRLIRDREAYPRGADPETRKFVRYWFDKSARRQLAALSSAIARTRNAATRNILWCAFSRLIIVKQAGASLALDLAHSRPHKRFKQAPIMPFEKFLQSMEYVLSNCIDKRENNRGPAPTIRRGDARCLPFRDGTLDLVLTSPPYLNAIDYMRCSKFSLVWMGYTVGELRSLRSRSIGTEKGEHYDIGAPEAISIIRQLNLKPRMSFRSESILARYITDMRASIREVYRVLSSGGEAIYVIGENTIRGTYIRNATLITAIAKEFGFRLKQESARLLPGNRRYLPPPAETKRSAPLDARMRREVVLTFEKHRGLA